jgi:hypothetical protein
MTGPLRVLLLVGSPRGRRSTSTAVGSYLMNLMKQEGLELLTPLWIGPILKTQEKVSQLLEAVDAADIIVLAAPLYDDCQPYIVIKAMELIASHQKELAKAQKKSDGKLFSVIVNCAFPEEHHTQTVIRIYRKFAEDVGFRWGGSLAIRAGETLRGREGKTLDDAADETMSVIPESFSRGFFSFLGSFFIWLSNRMWAKQAKKKGEDVSARPYAQ